MRKSLMPVKFGPKNYCKIFVLTKYYCQSALGMYGPLILMHALCTIISNAPPLPNLEDLSLC